MHYIEPGNRHQSSLFSSLDDLVGFDNPVRLLDLLVDQIVSANPDRFLRCGLSNVGRRAYSPQTLLKLYLYGYFHGISSSRKLEAETKRNMELMWLLGRLSPDHKTISDYRKDHSDAIRFLTLRFREYLIDENYITGRRIALDGTKLKANAARQKFLRTKSLERRIKGLEARLSDYLDQLKRNDIVEDVEDGNDGDQDLNAALVEKICELEAQIDVLHNQKHEVESSSQKMVHPTDPDCRRMRSRDDFLPAYNLQMVTDMAHGMIALAQIRQEPGDHGLSEEMLDVLEEETSIVPKAFYADKAYFSAQQLHWLEVDRGITSWVGVPLLSPEKKDLEAGISFQYQARSDSYICSQGRVLHKRTVSRLKQATYYRAKNCASCPIKDKCTQTANRSIKIPFLKPWIDRFKARMNSQSGRNAMRARRIWGEHPFGTLKNWMGVNHLKLRGRTKVQTEIDLHTTAYNLKRMFKIDEHQTIERLIKSYNWMGS